MKVLLDTCIRKSVRDVLNRAGHDTIWSGDWNPDPGDREILKRAHAENRIVITLDKDFGELAVLHAEPHSGIVRLIDISGPQQADICTRILERYASDLVPGTILTFAEGNVRIRHPS